MSQWPELQTAPKYHTLTNTVTPETLTVSVKNHTTLRKRDNNLKFRYALTEFSLSFTHLILNNVELFLRNTKNKIVFFFKSTSLIQIRSQKSNAFDSITHEFKIRHVLFYSSSAQEAKAYGRVQPKPSRTAECPLRMVAAVVQNDVCRIAVVHSKYNLTRF